MALTSLTLNTVYDFWAALFSFHKSGITLIIVSCMSLYVLHL